MEVTAYGKKQKNESNNKNSGTLLTEKDGTSILSWGKSVSRYRSISHRMGSRLTACWKM